MDQDRAEVAAKGPAQASKAQKLGDGPNIMRAGDVGIGQIMLLLRQRNQNQSMNLDSDL